MNANRMQFSPNVANALLALNDPAVHEAVMSDLPTLHRLNSMDNPIDVGVAVGQIKNRVAAKNKSNAPAPVPKVNDGGSSSATLKDERKAGSMAEFMAIRNAQGR